MTILIYIKEKQNFAVAVDENGCNDGIITMDDILAAVFGRLADEYDKKAVPIEQDTDLGFFGDIVGICPKCGNEIVLYDNTSFLTIRCKTSNCLVDYAKGI